MARKRTLLTDVLGLPVTEGGINSKNKGDKNERVASDWMELWTGVRFIRTPSSGGRRLVNASNFCGDIVCEDENFDFMFAVETKHWGKLAMSKKLRSNSVVYTILEQARQDAVRAKKKPMLMLRKNGMPKMTYVIYFENDVADLLQLEPTSTGNGIKGFDSVELLATISYGELEKLVNAAT